MVRVPTQRATAGRFPRFLAMAGAVVARVPARQAAAGLLAAVVTVAAVGFPALVGFRCLATGAVHDRPCCDRVGAPAADDGGARIAGICCRLELREAVQALAGSTPGPDVSVTPALVPVGTAVVAVAERALPKGVRTHGPPPGPPLRLRDCSLLI
jgi:hypothetical protein